MKIILVDNVGIGACPSAQEKSAMRKSKQLKIVSASDIKPGYIFIMFANGQDGGIKVVDNIGNDLKYQELADQLLLYNP